MRIEEKEFLLPSGEKVIIRSAGPEDAEQIKDLRETTSAETHFMARDPEDGKMNVERVRTVMDATAKSEREFMVTAFIGNQVIGDLGIMLIRPHVKYLHRAYLGMSIRQKYTGMGLGSFMMQVALEQAKKNGFEQVELGVYADNARARHLYEKNGFKEYGVNPRAFKLTDGTYIDEIIMVHIFE